MSVRANPHPNRVMTVGQWCELNGFSYTTGWRIRKSGDGPETIALSPGREGITEAANAAWQAERRHRLPRKETTGRPRGRPRKAAAAIAAE
jgi:predicted DNA-binding transcriptional regulator AlpA